MRWERVGVGYAIKRQVPWVEQGLWEQSVGNTAAASLGLEVMQTQDTVWKPLLFGWFYCFVFLKNFSTPM